MQTDPESQMPTTATKYSVEDNPENGIHVILAGMKAHAAEKLQNKESVPKITHDMYAVMSVNLAPPEFA